MVYNDSKQPLIRLILNEINNLINDSDDYESMLDKFSSIICKDTESIYANIDNEIVSIVVAIHNSMFNKRFLLKNYYNFNGFISYEIELGYYLEQNLSINELEKVLFKIV